MRVNHLLAVLLLLIFCAPVFAGPQPGSKGPKAPDTDKQRQEAQRRAQKAQAEKERQEKEAEREQAKEEREAKAAEKNGAPPPVKPGDTVIDDVKQTWIDSEMDKLAMTSKSDRTAFSKLVLKAWKDSETEDARYAKEYDAAKGNAELLDPARKAHLDKLKKIWDDLDTDATKKHLLDDVRLKAWQADSKFLREKTATDKFEDQEKAKAAKKTPKKKPDAEKPEGDAPKGDTPDKGAGN